MLNSMGSPTQTYIYDDDENGKRSDDTLITKRITTPNSQSTKRTHFNVIWKKGRPRTHRSSFPIQ